MTTYTARSFEKAQFAHHPDGRVAARINDHEYPWAGLNVGGVRENFGDGEMARKGWVPVQEAEADEVDLSGEMLRIAKEHQAVVNRAEKAEQERDEANDALAEYVKARVARDPLTAREHLDAAWEAAHVPADGTIPAGALYLEIYGDGSMYGPLSAGSDMQGIRGGLERRLLDPPAPSRPEGAEGVETALLDADEAGFFNIAPRAIQDLADWLAAERGVRVTGAES